MAKWSIPIRTITGRKKDELQKIVQKATFSMFNQIQLAWPVDTGLSRGNWQFGFNAYAPGPVTRLDPSGAAALTEAKKALTTPVGGTVYYTNNISYARPLEYGSSPQMPNGVVRIAAMNFEMHLRAAAKGQK